jgi:hypothetical protein
VRFDPIIPMMIDGPHFQRRALERSEGLLHLAQALVASHNSLLAHLLFGHGGLDDVAAIQRSLSGQFFFVHTPFQGAFYHLPLNPKTGLEVV